MDANSNSMSSMRKPQKRWESGSFVRNHQLMMVINWVKLPTREEARNEMLAVRTLLFFSLEMW